MKNGGNHKKPEKRGEKGQEKGSCERPYCKLCRVIFT
jgi:hypothetical protein